MKKDLLILNVLAIIFYCAVYFNLKIGISWELLFSTPDARTYWDVAEWLAGGDAHFSISTRPIFYPFLLLVSSTFGGAVGIWIMQILFWIATVNLTFRSVMSLTENRFLSFASAALLMSNVSLLVLTLHGLTEVTTTFLLSALVYFIVRHRSRWKEVYFIFGCLLLLVLLTIVKPVFVYPTYLTIFLLMPLLYLRKIIQRPAHLFTLLVIVAPLILQLTIMKSKFGVVTVSQISSNTLSTYLIAQGIEELESVSREESRSQGLAMSSEEQRSYMSENKLAFAELFIGNIQSNIAGAPTFLYYPKGIEHPLAGKLMHLFNRAMLPVHYLFLFLIPVWLLVSFKRKRQDDLVVLLTLSFLCSYFITTTGVSFWQGDRLVLPAVAIWAALYPFVLYRIFEEAKEKYAIWKSPSTLEH